MIEKELTILKEKAAKWDALEAKIAACYFDENGDELDGDADLCDIGEIAAAAFGFL